MLSTANAGHAGMAAAQASKRAQEVAEHSKYIFYSDKYGPTLLYSLLIRRS